MKTIEQLSKKELAGAFKQQFQDVYWKESVFECALCGDTKNAQFYYLCDQCQQPSNKKITVDACKHKHRLYSGSNICPDCGSIVGQ